MFVVEVFYASQDAQRLIRVDAEEKMTVEEVIDASNIVSYFPEIAMDTARVGIFGQRVCLDQPVSPGDRIEIYRPLIIDPKVARQHRAKKK